MNDEADPEYELLMPFVTVTSVGGPHDDAAYTAGFEMGRYDATLATSMDGDRIDTIRTENVPQADLIAMRYGFTVKWVREVAEGWSDVRLTR